MREFDDSTLWRISAYERFRDENGHSGFAALNGTTALPTTLAAELTTLEHRRRSRGLVDVLAACIRKSESALISLRHRDLVWPLTGFPHSRLYQLSRPIIDRLDGSNRGMEGFAVEPPGLRPPGHVISPGPRGSLCHGRVDEQPVKSTTAKMATVHRVAPENERAVSTMVKVYRHLAQPPVSNAPVERLVPP